jgi:hypothetical protein
VECDCLTATKMISDTEVNTRSYAAVLVNDVKRLCKQGREFQIWHINRELNSVSHTLARWGYTEKYT